MNTNNGLIYVFTGDGKGKTSAALGTAIRALSAGLRVAMVQWYKDARWNSSEHSLSHLLTSEAKQRFALYPMGVGFHIPHAKSAPVAGGRQVVDTASQQQHQQAASAALEKAKTLVTQVDVLILDEINNAVADTLLDIQDVVNLIQQRGKTHLILTGRNIHPQISSAADLVTDMKKIKHPYDQGKSAVKGLDF